MEVSHLMTMMTLLFCTGCGQATLESANDPGQAAVQTGADQIDLVVKELTGKRVALVANATSQVNGVSLVDTLLSLQVDIRKIFTPEHGFRASADAGEKIETGVDPRTGLPMVSLYGSNRKPLPEDLADVDELVFDIQDVGARFYTYISTLHHVMESCAENKKKLLVLDRPNPNGHYVDGPIRQPAFQSFVGMDPLPIVHGLTVGELSRMINGEGWLDSMKCDLQVIPVRNWKHGDAYSLPVRPSPNLPNDHAINLYPSVCLLEGTAISVGRGTAHPFEWIGHPKIDQSFRFTPASTAGASHPPYEGQPCRGLDLTKDPRLDHINLGYVISMYQAFPDKDKFFTPYFSKLAGNDQLEQQIRNGMSEEEIRESWEPDLENYRKMREKYLLY